MAPIARQLRIAGAWLWMAMGCTSCTIYLKDWIQGSPFDRTYHQAYRSARASGTSHEQAHRFALLHAGQMHNDTWNRRNRDREESEESDEALWGESDADETVIKWD